MAGGRADVVRQVHRLFGTGTVAGLSDGELLRRFAAHRDELAFMALVERHGPMVLRVCRSVLGDGDADDAFQATFLVLARRAHSLWVRDSLGSWLFGVARRAATRARRAAARRSRHEREAAEDGRIEAGSGYDPEWAELAAIVVEEVDRLPGSYRAAVVLCYLEGLTYEEAAGRLGVSEGTVRGRLSRARERLRVRLLQRGIGVSAVLMPGGMVLPRSASAVPADLMDAAVRAALSTCAGKQAAAGAVSATALALGNGVMKETAMSVLKTAAAVLVVACCAFATAWGFQARATGEAADPFAPPPRLPSGAKQNELERSSQAPDEPALRIKDIPKPWETTVRVKVHGEGTIGVVSGTVIRSTPEESLILTCGHAFKLDGRPNAPPIRYPNRITVDLFDGKLERAGQAQVRFLETIVAQMVDYDLVRDVGLLRIRPNRTLPASPIVLPSWNPVSGVEMVTAGCSEGRDATFWTTEIIISGTVRLFANNPYEGIECRYAPKQSRSGGGLFTTDGELAGVCNFSEPRGDHGFYAAPRSIYRILDRNGLSSLYMKGLSGVEWPAALTEPTNAPNTPNDLAFPIGRAMDAPSLADHERRLREVEQKLERLLRERDGGVENPRGVQ